MVDYFKNKLCALFPEARQLQDVHEWAPEDAIALLIAPVKSEKRIRVKVQEYASEHGNDVTKWPFTQCVGDMLRAVCASMDLVAQAWTRISSEAGFDVREGHGRLKNNWFTDQARPPDMLINAVVDMPAMPPITGEIQVSARHPQGQGGGVPPAVRDRARLVR